MGGKEERKKGKGGICTQILRVTPCAVRGREASAQAAGRLLGMRGEDAQRRGGGRETRVRRAPGAPLDARGSGPAASDPDRASSWAPEGRLARVRPQQASNATTTVSFELGGGNATRPGGSPGPHRPPRLRLQCGRPRGAGELSPGPARARPLPRPPSSRSASLEGKILPAPATPQIQNGPPTPPAPAAGRGLGWDPPVSGCLLAPVLGSRAWRRDLASSAQPPTCGRRL